MLTLDSRSQGKSRKVVIYFTQCVLRQVDSVVNKETSRVTECLTVHLVPGNSVIGTFVCHATQGESTCVTKESSWEEGLFAILCEHTTEIVESSAPLKAIRTVKPNPEFR